MISLKDWLELTEYKITEINARYWGCFGGDTQLFTYWNEKYHEYSVNIIVDTQTNTAFIAEICDYRNNRAYRLFNPEYRQAYFDEVLRYDSEDMAWDEVPWIDLELDEDFMEKARAIINQEPYDTRISVPLDLSEKEMLMLFNQAHKHDLSLNQYVEKILVKFVEQEKTQT